MKREEFGYSMPVHAPLYPEPPYYYEAKVVQIIGKANPEAVKKFVPEPFTPDENYIVTFVVAEYPRITSPGKPEIGPYNESFILIGVKLEDEVGALCPHMYVTTDLALGAGREVWGFPKKIAKIRILMENGNIRGITERGGKRILDILVESPQKVDIPPPALPQIFLFKVIPDVNKDIASKISISSVVMEDVKADELKMGAAKVDMEESETDPLYLLKPETILGGGYMEGKMTLPPGKTVKVL